LTFTGCVSKTTGCTLEGTKISTVPIVAEATLEGALAVKVKFSPKTKNTFATFKFNGTCAAVGTNPVTGHATVLAPTGQDEKVLQLVTSITTEKAEELFVGSSPASLTGSANLQLESGAPWSYL
jgi:hypothetical protein